MELAFPVWDNSISFVEHASFPGLRVDAFYIVAYENNRTAELPSKRPGHNMAIDPLR